MAAELVGGALLGTALNEFYKVVKSGVMKTVWCKKYCKELALDLERLQPILNQVSAHLQRESWEQHLLDLKDTLEKGRSLVEACIQLRGWHPYQKYRRSRDILKLRQNILQLVGYLPAVNTLQLQLVNESLQHVVNQQDELQKSIDPVIKAVVSGDKTLVADLMRQANCTGTLEGQTSTQQGKQLDELPVEPFLVGVGNPIEEVKSLLFSGEEKMVMIVGGMGGIGKTTLALSICKDKQVREFFQDRIHFFTVSQSPDMKGLLSTIWQQVVAGDQPVPRFQNEEDACRQLKGKLLSMPSLPRLLVLDDVWSKVNLQSLLFEVECCRTLITTRQAPTLEIHHSQTDTLGLLSEENAERLFCHWAFRQDSIPEWADETVVKEVISECNCLPLALKVIGSSLFDVRAPMAWRNARTKLREGRTLEEYRDGVLKKLQASFDALDPILRECFLDLGAFPEDSLCSINALLDIWMYVREMEWEDAVLALAELSSRCLLDISIVERNDLLHELEYGDASKVEFSQHDVMRDLALYLCRGNQAPSKCSRLLMPQEGKIPKDWQSEAPLEAQLVSVSTGAMMEQEWPSMLAFPSTEALHLYCDKGDYYHLPPFVQSMYKLKVMRIRCSNLRDMQPEIFGNLHNLTTLDLCSSTLEELPESFGELSCLEHLRLEKCRWLKRLPQNFGLLRNLKRLDMAGCWPLEELPESFGELSCLEHLSLRKCYVLKRLPQNFGLLRNLKRLDMANCEALKELAKSFGELSCLEHLSLEGCRRLERLPQNFGLLRNLKRLDMDYCDALKELAESFGELSCLEYLSLQVCLQLERLPQNFGLLRNLKWLDMDYCEALEELPESYGELSCLEHLSLHRCPDLRRLPQNFGLQIWQSVSAIWQSG